MTRKTLIIVAVMVAVVMLAYVAGYWSLYGPNRTLQTENDALQSGVVTLEDRARLSMIHIKMLDAIDAVAAMNYGQAQALASSLFDDIRAELNRTTNATYRQALKEALDRRDAMTAALATGDASVLQPLREVERRIRQVLSTPLAVSA
jgi:preprotein translocase subunit SecE